MEEQVARRPPSPLPRDKRMGGPVLGLAPRVPQLPVKQQHPHALLSAFHGVPRVVVNQKGCPNLPAQYKQGCELRFLGCKGLAAALILAQRGMSVLEA